MTAKIMFATSQRYWNIIRKLCQVVICISKSEILYMKYIFFKLLGCQSIVERYANPNM